MAGLGARHRDALDRVLGTGLGGATAVPHADESAHAELDEVEREEPDDVPDPGDTNPAAPAREYDQYEVPRARRGLIFDVRNALDL